MPNESSVNIVMGVDPGHTGGMAVLIGESAIVYSPPLEKVTVNKKERTIYDIKAMFNLLKPFAGQNVLFAIEKVMTRPGESPIASFSFGEGIGYWKMAATACDFKIVEIPSPTWKKGYPEMLASPEILGLRESIKALNAQSKLIKDKAQKNSIKKELSSLNRQLKGLAKDAARELASKLYPDIADNFKLKKDDGKAEAVLIARFVKNTYHIKGNNELVS